MCTGVAVLNRSDSKYNRVPNTTKRLFEQPSLIFLYANKYCSNVGVSSAYVNELQYQIEVILIIQEY